MSDFGLSQVMLDAAATLMTQDYSGTVTHMPPELLEDGKVYPQGDVYAFGIMMWEVRGGATVQNVDRGEGLRDVGPEGRGPVGGGGTTQCGGPATP